MEQEDTLSSLSGPELIERLQQLEKAFDTMQVGVTITDCKRKILYLNRAEAEMHGYSKAELLGKDAAFFAPDALRHEPMERDKLRRLNSWRRESINIRRDGASFPVEILSDVVLDAQGTPTGIVSISQDITDRKRAQEELRESEERYALALTGANDGLWDWNLKSGEIFLSTRWKSMLGFEPRELTDGPDTWFSRVHLEDLDGLKNDLDRHLAGLADSLRNEHRMLHKDGDYRWMLARGVAVRDEEGRATRIAGSQTDITERKVHDPLTGLPNRALFLDRLTNALRRNRRRMGRMNAVLFLDLDRFKVVNDSLGHLAGDQLLVQVAETLRSCLRPGDTVARMSGDEFTILLEAIHDTDDAIKVAERIREELHHPFSIGDEEVFTSASVGIALSVSGREKAHELLRDADTAMYRAKAKGTGRHLLFDQDMRDQAVAQLRVETDLRRAVERHEFLLHYQPIIAISDDSVVGFEALIRWAHPDRGLLGPYDFIPAAEETGLILPIGRWVLEEACRQLRTWQSNHPRTKDFTVSVNLSPKQFNHPRLVHQIEEALKASKLEPRSLQIEVTESAFVDNMERAIDMLHAIQRMGVIVAIDDFGTGYSSLAYLNRFPVDSLKIDRSFIRKMGSENKQHELVRTIIRMASNLGIDVVAEGVETSEQHQHLKDLHCGFFQGFSVSKPIPPDQFEEKFLDMDDTQS
ncbi:MAG: EAL domain-containing protein [Acidobacteriota bacterium]|nr:EAL domain-containing protein [Acidobacteriota bacterium]